MSVPAPLPTVPIWGDTSTNIVVPPSGSYHPGFATGAQVPSGWLNWFWNLSYQWFLWLSNAFQPIAPTHPTQQNGYADLAGTQTLQYWQDQFSGAVHIAGTAFSSGGTANAALIWNAGALSSAMRPSLVLYRSCYVTLHAGGAEAGFVKVFADGSMNINSASGGNIGQVNIDISFIPGI